MTVARIGIGQINPRMGDFEGNTRLILEAAAKARDSGVQLLIFPEMALTGFSTDDLAGRDSFVAAAVAAMSAVARALARSRMLLVVGGLENDDALYKGAAVIHRGEILGFARKRYLFCCGRYDESRYFSAGERTLVIETDKFRAAVTLGDDLGYPVFPAEIELLLNLWNEPYHFGHRPVRERMMIERSREDAVAMVLASPVGGHDDLLFEGASVVVDGFGEVIARGRSLSPDLVVADLDLRELKAHRARIFHSSRPRPESLSKVKLVRLLDPWPEKRKPARIQSRIEPRPKGPPEIFSAIVVATRDFVAKNGFGQAFIGLSGGIDSALTAAIAAEALGPKLVTAVSMPSPYNSDETKRDARATAKNLGIRFRQIPITALFSSALAALAPAFKRRPPDVTEENLQARLRGLLLMALANKAKGVVLASGNKSELATGYCTLYGDTVGAFAPLKDLYKTQVFQLAEWYNHHQGRDLIPRSVIERPPSAELRPGQTDQDTLPPYPTLDRILAGLVEKGHSMAELIDEGEDEETVRAVFRLLLSSEFKRRQYPIGPSVSERPLTDLTFPITKKIGWWETDPPAGKDNHE